MITRLVTLRNRNLKIYGRMLISQKEVISLFFIFRPTTWLTARSGASVGRDEPWRSHTGYHPSSSRPVPNGQQTPTTR